MNNTKKLRSALLSSLTIIASIVLGHTAQAATLYFEPEGNQLDNDDILDIDVTGKKRIAFKIFIDTKGLVDKIMIFRYIVDFDPGELKFQSIAVGEADPNKGIQGADVTDKFTIVQDSFLVEDGSDVAGKGLDIAPGKIVHITTITFDVVKPGLKPDDGKFDFKIRGASGTDANGAALPVFKYGKNNNAVSQEVEVQVPEPTSTLGLFSLGIIGAGATIKRQVKRNHSIEKETTEIG